MTPEELKQYKKNWYVSHIDRNKEIAKKYKEENSEKIKEKNKIYRENNKEKIIKWREENKEHVKEYKKKYKQDHKKERNHTNRERKKTDDLFSLTCNVRRTIHKSLKNKGYSKTSRSYEIIGCTYEEFKKHLESKFESWMSWDNYGKYNGELNFGWDIDHIIPNSSGKNEVDVLKLQHYTNLQPLCSFINRNIKKDLIVY
jgi:hypothetical protein